MLDSTSTFKLRYYMILCPARTLWAKEPVPVLFYVLIHPCLQLVRLFIFYISRFPFP